MQFSGSDNSVFSTLNFHLRNCPLMKSLTTHLDETWSRPTFALIIKVAQECMLPLFIINTWSDSSSPIWEAVSGECFFIKEFHSVGTSNTYQLMVHTLATSNWRQTSRHHCKLIHPFTLVLQRVFTRFEKNLNKSNLNFFSKRTPMLRFLKRSLS